MKAIGCFIVNSGSCRVIHTRQQDKAGLMSRFTLTTHCLASKEASTSISSLLTALKKEKYLRATQVFRFTVPYQAFGS